jgi:hypothetical protein
MNLLIKDILNLKFTIIFIFLSFSFQTAGANKIIYIDPGNKNLGRNGTIKNPYNSWDEIKPVSNTIYKIKRSTMLILYRPLNFGSKTGITVETYGEGNIPVINTKYVEKPININSSENITIKDIHINGNSNSIYCIRIMGNSKDIYIKNCTFTRAMWGMRLMGQENQTHKHNINIISCKISNTGDDGIYAQNINRLKIDSCQITKVNQKWFTLGKAESQASGDGIQLENCSGFIVSNCKIDRTDTGNKFCVVANNSRKGEILGNQLKGPSPKGSGGACIYLGFVTDSIEVCYNLLSHSPCGIYSHAKSIKLFKNILTENGIGMWLINSINGVIVNNTFWNNAVALNAQNVHVLNNIFYASSIKHHMVYLKKPFTENYNCYFISEPNKLFDGYGSLVWFSFATGNGKNSIFCDPLFENNPDGNFNLVKSSPCIDKGSNKFRKWNLSINYCGDAVDIGAKEFCSDTFSSKSTY